MSAFSVAIRNVRKSFKDYGIYFLTVMLGVALFYIFNSIGSQSVMMDLSQNAVMSLMGIETIMDYLSVFVAAIMAFLILYANAFLIRRRKKEMGLYMVLGMKKFRISSILVWETFLVGLLSLAVGLAVGIFLSQGMALVTARMFGVSVTRFAFAFSAAALLKCVRYFGLSFLAVILFNVVNLNRQRLLDLLHADRKTARVARLPFWASVPLFAVSAAMLLYAYRLVLTTGIAGFILEGGQSALTRAVLLGTAGTFLFFFSLSGFSLKLVSRVKGVYFKNLNMFTLKQLDSKFHAAWASMSFVCLMLFLALSAISVGTSLSMAIREYSAAETAASVAVAYMATYIGIVFLISCASVLAIAQLSEASDNQSRYALLSKLGASPKMLSGSALRQILAYFVAPLALAAAHSLVAVKVMGALVEALASLNIFATSLVTGGAVALFYGGYFLMTYRSARRMALRQ
ncbi:MAG: ABC transporter permease [Clostridiales Family XIII bacterium]|jgi:putative ABC transport system permease protein|nr:ABC transporter permease [Clostridiales Family XIII bacterium]